jgi:hypothetical protein
VRNAAADAPENTSGLLISLIAAGAEETVSTGIPYGALALESLDTPQVREWVWRNNRSRIYVTAGHGTESGGVAALCVPASAEDYERVLSAMPR